MRIAHNAIMDWYRDQSSRCIVKAGKDNDLSNIGGDDIMEGNIESAYVNRQVMNDVRRLLDMLPPIQREVVYMRYYQQLSFKEIADTTSVSINTPSFVCAMPCSTCVAWRRATASRSN